MNSREKVELFVSMVMVAFGVFFMVTDKFSEAAAYFALAAWMKPSVGG